MVERSPIRPCSGRGLPCHRRYRRRGALLPHRFTLACSARSLAQPSAVSSLWHFPWTRIPQALPGAPIRGARTFLPTTHLPRIPARIIGFSPTNLWMVSGRAIAWPTPKSYFNEVASACRRSATAARTRLASAPLRNSERHPTNVRLGKCFFRATFEANPSPPENGSNLYGRRNGNPALGVSYPF